MKKTQYRFYFHIIYGIIISKRLNASDDYYLTARLCPLSFDIIRNSRVSFTQPTTTDCQRVQIFRRTIFDDVREIESRRVGTLHHKLSSVMSLRLSSDITNALTRHVLTSTKG